MKIRIVPIILLLAAVAVFVLLPRGFRLDQAPTADGEWGYRPAGAEATDTNPPAFTWRPTDGAESYFLQIATDQDFTSLVYQAGDLPWTAHCPPVPLSPGQLYWRYAAADADGRRTGWSRTRSFEVSAVAPIFPQPKIADLVSRLPVDHPRLFLRPEDLPRWRELAAGPLAKPAGEVIASADSLLASPPDTTEPPLYPEEVIQFSGEWREIWWSNRLRTIGVVSGAARLGLAYRLTGDEKYGRAARDLLMAFARWDPAGATNYRYNDEAAMPALNYSARAFTWAWPLLSDNDRAEITAVMRIRGNDCFNHLREYRHLWHPYNSHQNRSWHWLGEVAIAFYDVIPEARQWLDYAMTIMYTAYPVWNDEDGGWHEGLAYWSSYLSKFMYWTDVVRSAFDIDVFEKPVFQQTGNFGLYLAPPGTHGGGFGDLAIDVTSESLGGLMASLAGAAGNPHWQWYADAVGGEVEDFVRAADLSPPNSRPPLDLPASICFPGVGLAVLNSDLLDGTKNVQVQFKSNPTLGTYSHGYNANNAFLLSLGGEPVFLRSGRRDVFRSDHHANWMWHTKSDNAILVNGQGQYKRTFRSRGRITAFATSPTVDVTVGEAGEAYADLERWTRRLIFLKPHALLIHDIVEAQEPSTYQWLLHASGPFVIGPDKAAWRGAPGQADVTFVYPSGMAITQVDSCTPPPAAWTGWKLDQWHLMAEPAQQARRQEFLTIVVLDGADVQWTTANRENGSPSAVTISLPDDHVEIELQDRKFSVTASGFSGTFPAAETALTDEK